MQHFLQPPLLDDPAALATFIDAAPSPWHAVQLLADALSAEGFFELPSARIEEGRFLFFKRGGSLFALRPGIKPGFRLVLSHSDWPTFRLKEDLLAPSGGIQRLQVEPYGGMILSAWMDRPLYVAGRLFFQSDDPFHPETLLVQSNQPLAIMSHCCVHLNRDVNEAYTYSAERDLVPLTFTDGKEVTHLLAEQAEKDPSTLLAGELILQPQEKAIILSDDLISAPHLDNLGMVAASFSAFLTAGAGGSSQVFAVMNHEEIGSASAEGAASPVLVNFLRQASDVLYGKTHWPEVLAESFAISADQAHAHHPNYLDKMDVHHAPMINGGPVLKMAAGGAYATDGSGVAVLRALAEHAGVPLQTYHNRADVRGGSTLGPILSRHLTMPVADIGNPILAMHSVRELGGLRDQEMMIRLLKTFYEV